MKKLYFLFAFTFATAAFAQTTYRTTTFGDWDNPAKWENGAIPPDNIGVNDVVLIEHNTYLSNKDITNNGTIRITAGAGYQDGTHIVNNGKIIISAEGSITTRYSSGCTFTNNYALDNSGVFWNVDNFTNNGYLFNQGHFYNYQKLFYDGVTMQCSDGGRIVNNNVICNTGGYILNACGSTATGNAAITGCSTLRDDIMNATLGINATFQESFSVSPNPTSGLISVKFDNAENAKMEIFDNNGKTVSVRSKTTTNNTDLDLSALSNGVYFIQITNGKQTAVKKIIKQ